MLAFPEPFSVSRQKGSHMSSLSSGSCSTCVECRLSGSGSRSGGEFKAKVRGHWGLHGRGRCGEPRREHV